MQVPDSADEALNLADGIPVELGVGVAADQLAASVELQKKIGHLSEAKTMQRMGWEDCCFLGFVVVAGTLFRMGLVEPSGVVYPVHVVVHPVPVVVYPAPVVVA